MKINNINNHNSTPKKTQKDCAKPSFQGKAERELFEAIVEKRVNKKFVSIDDLKEAFLDVVSAFQERNYYTRKSKTPAPVKESFKLPHGHFSIALFPESKTILARDVLSTKEKSGENVIMYTLDNGSVMKKLMKAYKDSNGRVISDSVANQTWLMDTKTGEFNLLG